MIGAKVTGVEATARYIRQRGHKTTEKVDTVLYNWANAIYRRSQVLVPKQTGRLARSGRVIGNGKKGAGARYSVEYGGPGAPYALWVHENTMAYHKPPTTHHYLLRAAQDGRIRRNAVKALSEAGASTSLTKTIS